MSTPLTSRQPTRARAGATARGGVPAWLGGARVAKRAHLAVGLVVPLLVLLVEAFETRAFTVDDAFISFRYAESFAKGLGLTYGPGERVEGYTNFLWTLALGLAARAGAPPETTAKVLGVVCACVALAATFVLARRLRPLGAAPCFATWLLATSLPFTGYATFGLETPLFQALVLVGTALYFREGDRPGAFPASGIVFALAALTRPEALVLFAVLGVFCPTRLGSRQTQLRLALFALPLLAHLLFRRAYYGAWVPNTLWAKTGDIRSQLAWGSAYLGNYLRHMGAPMWLALGSLAVSFVRGRRDGLALAAMAIVWATYVALVGADAMPYFRLLAPAEPFLFLLIDDAVRAVFDRREKAPAVAMGAFVAVMGFARLRALSEAQKNILQNDKAFWDDAAGRTADWLVRAERGPVAVAEVGYIGYATGYPIVDLVGLLSPEVARLPGAYGQKSGRALVDVVLARSPRYAVIVATDRTCRTPNAAASHALLEDPRFHAGFELRQPIALRRGGAWCIYEKRASPVPPS